MYGRGRSRSVQSAQLAAGALRSPQGHCEMVGGRLQSPMAPGGDVSPGRDSPRNREAVDHASLDAQTIVIVLLILWLLGWLVVPVAGNLVHLLLVVILVVAVIRVLQGRSPLA